MKPAPTATITDTETNPTHYLRTTHTHLTDDGTSKRATANYLKIQMQSHPCIPIYWCVPAVSGDRNETVRADLLSALRVGG